MSSRLLSCTLQLVGNPLWRLSVKLTLFLVTTYPSDPQASIGLHKCMDTLKLMQSVWPSAWRANQLLRGSKVHTLDTRASASPAGSERNKRTAERLNDDVGQDVRISGSHMYRQSQNFARPSNGGHPGFPLAIDDLPSTESPTFFQSFDRWAPDNSISTYPSSLSTSVLPQQYSTGLMDERSHRPPDRPNQRYPQYWSDYGALGQMETTYGVPLVGGMVPQNSAPSRGQQPVYSPDHQYSVFSKPSLILCCDTTT